VLEWSTAISLAALLLSAAIAVMRLTSASLSRFEHEEFKRRMEDALSLITRRQEERLVIREFSEWVVQFRRDIDRLTMDINRLDANKPTTGELDRTAAAAGARIEMIEERQKMLSNVLYDKAKDMK
jgi:hypothetical protein